MNDTHPKPANKARLTILDSVYYQNPDGSPILLDNRYVKILDSDEQPYGPRKVKVDSQWVEITSELCWVRSPSILVVNNEEGKGLQTYPTPEERLDISKRVLELAVFCDQLGSWVVVETILPGESRRGRPAPGSRWAVRCVHGSARTVFTVFPN